MANNNGSSGGRRVLTILWRCFLAYGLYNMAKSFRILHRYMGVSAMFRKLRTILIGTSRARLEVSIILGIIIGIFWFRRRLKQKREEEEAAAEEPILTEDDTDELPREEEYIPPTWQSYNS